MIVLKFGGSSVDTPEKLKNIEEIVRSELPRKPIVVVSALRDVTNNLHHLADSAYNGNELPITYVLRKHYQLSDELGLDPKILNPEFHELIDSLNPEGQSRLQFIDHIMSLGEKLSAKLIAEYLRNKGLNTASFNSYDLGLVTDSNFSEAEYLPECLPTIKTKISALDCLPIITGFIARDTHGNITTLGRNKSDYSAAIFANAVDAEELQIWTDVSGILTANPEIVPSARTIEQLSYNEAKELAFFGARVLHPRAIEPPEEKGIPIRVLNSLERNNPGTIISSYAPRNGVKGITSKPSVIIVNNKSGRMVDAHGHLAETFNAFNRYSKSVDAVATSNITISGTVDDDRSLVDIVKQISGRGKVKLIRGNAQICVVGDGLDETPGIQSRVFGTIQDITVRMISQAAASPYLTFLVDTSYEHEVVRRLHRELIDN